MSRSDDLLSNSGSLVDVESAENAMNVDMIR